MLIDTKSVSSWYVLHRGFRLTHECRNCQTELTHFKVYEKNYSGILSRCENCGKEIVRLRINNKAPFNGNSAVDNEILRRIREGSGLVEGFDGGVVQLLHS